jgi:hypothetical protein
MLRSIMLLAAGLTLGLYLTVASAAEPRTDEANAALDYIIGLQNPDGGFPAFGDESTPGSTLDAVFALIAGGFEPTPVYNKGASPVDYLVANAAEYASDPGAAAKLALAAALVARDPSVGVEPSDFGGVDLLAIMAGAVDPETGAYGLDLFDECLYLLALAAADEPVPDAVYQHLHSSRATDGGWEFTPGAGSDTNTTAMVVQALVAAGAPPGDHAVEVALGYLRTAQNDDGGFGFLPGEDTDPNSTALAIQAVVAAGRDVEADPYVRNGNTPLDALAAFQNPATGALQFFGEDSAFATYQAVPALLLAPFPDLAPSVVVGPTPEAPTVVEVTPAVTPLPTPSLPGAGGGPHGGDTSWWLAALLLAGGALGVGVATARRRG